MLINREKLVSTDGVYGTTYHLDEMGHYFSVMVDMDLYGQTGDGICLGML